MKSQLLKLFILTLFCSFYAATASAQCRSSNVCDDYGQNCRIQDICDNSLDLPSVNVPPVQPLPSMELKPLPSMALPPLGTSNCEYLQVNGHWQNVCH